MVMELTNKSGIPYPDGLDGRAPQAQSELNIWSAEIGSGINQASIKVSELRKMAKVKGIFNDKTPEIQELTLSVKHDIHMLNNRIEALEMKTKGTGPNRASQAHSSNMIDTLKTRLLEVTKDFKDALEARTITLEHQETRRKLYSAGQGASSNPFPHKHKSIDNPADLEGGGMGAVQSSTLAYTSARVEAVQSVQKNDYRIGSDVPEDGRHGTHTGRDDSADRS